MNNYNRLNIPNTSEYIYAGNKVKLGRFSKDTWIVSFGWYTWGGNRPVCGWYLVNLTDNSTLKPLQMTDLYDIIIIS